MIKSRNSILGKKGSIKKKLLVSLILVLLFIFMSTSVIIIKTVKHKFSENEMKLISQSTDNISNELDKFFNKYLTVAEQLAQDKNIQNYLLDVETKEDTMTSDLYEVTKTTLYDTQQANSDVIMFAYIAESNPSYYLDGEIGLSGDSFDLSTRDYYAAITNNSTFISDPYSDEATGSMVVTVAAPVTVNGKVEGLIALDISIDKIRLLLEEHTLGKNGFFTLLTNNNIIVSHRDTDNIFKSLDSIGLSNNILKVVNEKNYDVVKYTYNKENLIGSYDEIDDTGWKIISALSIDEFMENSTQITYLVSIIYILSEILLAVVMYLIIDNITKPINNITEITNKIAEGDLDVSINITNNDEIGQLASSIGRLVERLKTQITYLNESSDAISEMSQGNINIELKLKYDGEFAQLKESLLGLSENFTNLVSKIRTTSNLVNINAEVVSSSSQILSQGATEQASSIEELSSEINNIYDNIELNTKLAKEAEDIAVETSNDVEQGTKKINEMLIAIKDIDTTSGQISKIIKVIDDIAFQTNILALNATVEAARAGSAGKGFAVVADEVRNLANKSAEAAKQTTLLIENSIKAVSKGTALAEETDKALTTIVNKTNKTKEMVSEIYDVSEQQAASVEQIKTGIEQISSVVQETAHTAENEANTSRELLINSNELVELVKEFKIKE